MNTELATLTTQTIGLTNKLATMEKELNQFLDDFNKSGSSADKWLCKDHIETIHKYELALAEKNDKILKIINNDTIYQPPKVEMPYDLMSDIHNRVNAPHYATNMEGKLGIWKNGSFKLINF